MIRVIAMSAFVLALVTCPVLAQESESTTITTTETTMTMGDDYDLFGLWYMDDASVVPERTLEFRWHFAYVTEDGEAAPFEPGDDWELQNNLYWGVCPNVEMFIGVDSNLGDGWDTGDGMDGNHDGKIGFQWKFLEEGDMAPAMAFKTNLRVPTGYRSSGVDAEFRLIMTKNCTDWLRSHLYGFGTTVNGDNDPWQRDFQWGLGIGADGPLCDDGSVRWVVDYQHRSSEHYGRSNMNLGELGWEWTITPEHKIGMGLRAGLDDHDDTPNFGASFTYAFALGY